MSPVTGMDRLNDDRIISMFELLAAGASLAVLAKKPARGWYGAMMVDDGSGTNVIAPLR